MVNNLTERSCQASSKASSCPGYDFFVMKCVPFRNGIKEEGVFDFLTGGSDGLLFPVHVLLCPHIGETFGLSHHCMR